MTAFPSPLRYCWMALFTLLFATSSHSVSIENATFEESAFCRTQPLAQGTDHALPESVFLDYSSDGSQCIVSVLTTATGPQLDTQVSARGTIGGFTDGNGKATITYSMAILPVSESAPAGPVRVLATVLASAQASISGDETGYASASGYYEIWVPGTHSAPPTRKATGSSPAAPATTAMSRMARVAWI